MPALKAQIDELHHATYELTDAWDALADGVARRLEGWNDDEPRVTDAQQRVRLATEAANASLERALAKAVRDDP